LAASTAKLLLIKAVISGVTKPPGNGSKVNTIFEVIRPQRTHPLGRQASGSLRATTADARTDPKAISINPPLAKTIGIHGHRENVSSSD